MHEFANIDWVRPIDQLLQRILGLGGVYATKGDVERALLEDNEDEVLALMPAAAALVHRGQSQSLPALYGALAIQETRAIADCRHRCFTENMCTTQIAVPCGVGGS